MVCYEHLEYHQQYSRDGDHWGIRGSIGMLRMYRRLEQHRAV
jgi:hypothetical protein